MKNSKRDLRRAAPATYHRRPRQLASRCTSEARRRIDGADQSRADVGGFYSRDGDGTLDRQGAHGMKGFYGGDLVLFLIFLTVWPF